MGDNAIQKAATLQLSNLESLAKFLGWNSTKLIDVVKEKTGKPDLVSLTSNEAVALRDYMVAIRDGKAEGGSRDVNKDHKEEAPQQSPSKVEEKATKSTAGSAESYSLMERRDEEQIELEIRGHVINEMVYRFETGGKEVVGLSWVGTKELARRHGHISVEAIDITEDDHYFTVQAKARDIEKNVTMIGVSRQFKKMNTKLKGWIDDEFALQKATSKAQRNAIRALIPETYITAVIAELTKAKKQKAQERAS